MSTAAASQLETALEASLPARPYPGLRPFEKAEWPLFFGRERMCEDVIARLIQQRLLVVHGDSGCGKSSLIYAGVLPRLEQESNRGGERWVTAGAVPGDQPLWNLAKALASLRDGKAEAQVLELRRLLNLGREAPKALLEVLKRRPGEQFCLLLDQFEELFAYANTNPNSSDARLVVDFLLGVLQQRPDGLYVAVTMRSEFLGACAKFPGFAEAVNAAQYLLPRMEHADLLRAIREPATLYGGQVTRELADQLIEDAGGSQDHLPLIQHGLMRLHQRHVLDAKREDESWKLGVEHHDRRLCDLSSLLSAHADEIADGFEPPGPDGRTETRVIEDIFRRLTDINADGQAIRRRCRLSELVAVAKADEARVREIIDAFRREGVSLLRPYGTQPIGLDAHVDISHEALIRCWKRIADKRDGWLIREFKNGLVWRSLLVQADSFERNRSNVLSVATATERSQWLERRSEAWSARYGGGWDGVTAVVAASVEKARNDEKKRLDDLLREAKTTLDAMLQKQELERQQRAARNLRIGISVVIALLVTAAGLAVYAFKTRQEAFKNLAAANAAMKERDESDKKARAESEKARAALVAQADAVLAKNANTAATKVAIDNVQESLNVLSASATDAKARDAIASAQAVLDQQAASIAGAPRNPVAVNVAPRVYVQVSAADQLGVAQQLIQQMRQMQLGNQPLTVIPPNKPTKAKSNALRCFRPDECVEAKPLLDSLNAHLASPKLTLQDFSAQYKDKLNTIRPHHYELYFAPGAIRLAQ